MHHPSIAYLKHYFYLLYFQSVFIWWLANSNLVENFNWRLMHNGTVNREYFGLKCESNTVSSYNKVNICEHNLISAYSIHLKNVIVCSLSNWVCIITKEDWSVLILLSVNCALKSEILIFFILNKCLKWEINKKALIFCILEKIRHEFWQ